MDKNETLVVLKILYSQYGYFSWSSCQLDEQNDFTEWKRLPTYKDNKDMYIDNIFCWLYWLFPRKYFNVPIILAILCS